jgi:hypothetical protein
VLKITTLSVAQKSMIIGVTVIGTFWIEARKLITSKDKKLRLETR